MPNNQNPYGNLATSPLPMRAEKRIIPTPAEGLPASVLASDFNITAAMKPFTDYMQVIIPGRGLTASTTYSKNLPAVYRFLINPSQVTVTKTMMDAQSFSRGGWQFGVAGEAITNITMNGKTPGRYFHNGLTDQYAEFTLSYRNLEALENIYENNGYWFEGEQVNEGPLAGDATRRLIQSHQDVLLNVGEFQWRGMFDDLTIEESADEPFLATFNISFLAWKERYNDNTPYIDAVHNEVQRGHKKTWAPSSTNTTNTQTRTGSSSFVDSIMTPPTGVFGSGSSGVNA